MCLKRHRPSRTDVPYAAGVGWSLKGFIYKPVGIGRQRALCRNHAAHVVGRALCGCVGLKRKYNMTKRKDRTPAMIKPEEDLELSIKALRVYPIEPAIIKNMLYNLRKIVGKK